jgi:hypothetical protein
MTNFRAYHAELERTSSHAAMGAAGISFANPRRVVQWSSDAEAAPDINSSADPGAI